LCFGVVAGLCSGPGSALGGDSGPPSSRQRNIIFPSAPAAMNCASTGMKRSAAACDGAGSGKRIRYPTE